MENLNRRSAWRHKCFIFSGRGLLEGLNDKNELEERMESSNNKEDTAKIRILKNFHNASKSGGCLISLIWITSMS